MIVDVVGIAIQECRLELIVTCGPVVVSKYLALSYLTEQGEVEGVPLCAN